MNHKRANPTRRRRRTSTRRLMAGGDAARGRNAAHLPRFPRELR